MAAKRKRTKVVRSTKTNARIRARQIADFPELFEPSDAKRKKQKGGLSFTKSQVTTHFLSKEQEHRFFERMRMLKSHPQRYLLRSVFEDLKNWTAAKHCATRGHLVTAEGKPASYAYLAAQLQMPVGDLKKAVPILEQIGLIEWGALNAPPDGTGPSRTQPAPSGTKRKPLNNGKRKSNTNSKTKNKRKTTNGLTAPGCKNKGNGNGKKDVGTADATPTTPTTTPPMPTEPTGSDAGGHKVIPFTGGPPAAAGYSRAGLAYGRRVYLRLEYTWSMDSSEAEREITSFASKHDHVISRLRAQPPPAIDALLNRALRQATKIAKQKSAKNKGAVWNDFVNDLLTASLKRAAM